MKVVAALDSFKGSLTSVQAGEAVKEGILRAHPEAQVVVRPLADGGEGTTDAMIDGLGAERIVVTVHGPLGEPVHASYGVLNGQNTAVMEMAAAAGITLVNEKNPMRATTRGVGEMILDAINRGIRHFLIGIGGSATNDGGIGMLHALGWRFLTADGQDAGEGAAALSRIERIAPPEPQRQALYARCTFRIACDVTNPLCGSDGATYIYGPQKGIPENQIEEIDQAMSHFADVTADAFGADCRDVSGAGAAGGLGFAFLRYLNAQLLPGVQMILDAIGLEAELADADILVTGEGRLDAQTVMGKAPAGAARLAKKCGCRVIAFAGCVATDASVCHEVGIDAYFSIARGVMTPEEAMDPVTTHKNLAAVAEEVFRLL